MSDDKGRSRPSVASVTVSARGLVRKNNEDHVLCKEALGLFAVADGMGGGAEGELASQMVCDALADGVASPDYLTRLDEISAALAAANARVNAHARERGFRQMGSTVALLALDGPVGPRAAIAYIGDSRVYRLRAGAAELLTRDHSVGVELEARVGASAGSRFTARSNPLAHVLTRAIGTEATVAPEWRKIDLAAGDRYLVCSDGVHDVVETGELAALLAGPLDAAAKRLEETVVSRGAPDNYSFVLLEIGGV